MAGAPDLFVVCKNCQAEVSPYITECPYCGHRLRKRAPKLDKGGVPRPPKPSRRRAVRPKLPPLRRGELPGVGDGPRRPYAAFALVLGAIGVSVAARTTLLSPLDVVVGPSDDVWLRALLAPFLHVSTGYALVALGTTFLFAWLLGLRHGPVVPALVFLLSAVGGMWAVEALAPGSIAAGANGGALGLLAAWAVPDVLARRRGEDTGSDGLGVLVLAVVVLLLPAAVHEASAVAGVAGGLIGLLIGLVLARARRR